MTTEPREQQEPSMEEILSSIRRIIADEDSREDGADDELGAAEAESEGSDDDAEAIDRAAEDDEDPEEDVLELTRVVREGGEVVELQSERSTPDPAIEEGEPAEPVFAEHGADQEVAAAHHEFGDVTEDGADQEVAAANHESGNVAEDASQIDAPQPPQPQIDVTHHDVTHHKDKPVPSEQARNSELVSGSAATMATGAFAKLSHALQRTPEEESVADGSGRTVEQFVEDIARPMLKEWLDEHLPAIVERLVQKEIQKISRRAELN